MIRKLADDVEAGTSLDADEREIAALALQHVAEAEQAEIDAAWDEAIDRRVDEVVDGEETLASNGPRRSVASP